MARATLYRPEMCQEVVDFMSSGMSITEVAAKWKINPKTVHEWRKIHPEFAEALDDGVRFSEAWWENEGRMGIFGHTKKFNATGYIYTMKCRFKGQWLEDGTTNKLEVTTKHTNMSDKELNRLIEAKLNQNTIDITPKAVLIEHERP
jgi:hypothetical protein